MARLRWTRWIVASIITTLLVEAGAVAPASVVAAALTPPAVEQPAAAAPLAEPVPQLDPADEVTEARTATTATYDLGGGRFAVEVFPDPVFYQPEGSQAFVPIAAGFEPVPGPDKAALSAAAPTKVTVAPAADPRGFLAVEDEDGFRVAYQPLVTDGAADAAKAIAEPIVRDGIRSDIAEVFPGVDARIFARADGARLFLVLAQAPKVPSWTFRLDIPKGASLLPDKETGAIDIVDSDGTRRLVIAAPYAVDSTPDEFTGSGRTTTALHYTLGEANGAPTLTVSIDDAEWLAEAVYPVYVDPTIYNDGTTSYGDAHVNQGNPSFNYGNYQRPDSPYYYEMWLGESPSNSTYYNEAFIRFDLTSLAGKAIDSASMEVRPYHQYYNSPTTVRTWLRRVTSSWAENTITWNTKPTVTTTGTVTADCVEGAQCAFNILALTRAWVDGTSTNYGVRLDENGNGPTYWKRLIAAEQQTSTRPRLIVTYHDPVAVVYPSGGASSSRTFSWAYSGHSAQSAYEVQVATSDTFATIVADSGSVASAATSWGLPLATALTTGTPYHWRVRVKQAPNSAWSAWATTSFTYDPAALGLADHHRYETFDAGGGDALAVDVSTLNAVLTHPIVSLPYRGGRLDLTLTHNAQDTADVGLGRGWQLDVSRRIEQATSGTVILVDEMGGRHAFIGGTPSGGITPYARPHTLYGVLTKDTNVSPTRFTLTYKDQSKDTFELAGATARLVRAEDRHGNALTFEYTSGLLTKIKDPANRDVVLAWTGTPARLASITDWATVTGGIVAASGTPNRLHRFFYDGSGRLSGWAGPLYASGTCPATPTTTVVPHLACVGYDANGYLATISKARTRTTFSAGVLGTAVETATVAIDGAGTGEVRDVRDAASYPSGSPSTFRRTGSALVEVVRPGTPDATTRYALTAPTDDLARVTGISRKLGSAWIEQRTTWSTAFPAEPTSVVDNYVNGVVGDGTSPTVDDRTTSYTYGTTNPDTMGRIVTVSEPLDGTNTRVTEYTYNANHDVTLVKVSQNGTTAPVYTKTCYTTQANTCATSETGPSVVRQIENWVSGGPSTHDTNVATDFTSDSFGQRLTATRYNRDSAGALIDARVTAWAYGTSGGALGNVVSETVNVAGSSAYDADPDPVTNARTNLRTVHEYDSAGNRIATADPRRAILGAGAGAFDYRTTWTYDAANRQVTEMTPTTPLITITQKTATTVYDELGAVRSATDFGGRVTATRFDLAGRVLATYEDPAGTPPAVQTGAATYDAAGRVLTAKDQRQVAGSGGETQTTYDELGRTTSVKEAVVGGVPLSTTTTGYDRLDRVVSQSVGGADPTTTTYDLGGRAIHVNEGFTCTTTSYDVRDRITSVIEGRTPGATCTGTGSRTVSSAYDGLGRLTSRTAGSTVLEAFAFDAAGRATKSWSTEGVLERVTERTWNILDETATEYRYVLDTSTSTLSAQSWGRSNRDPAGNETDRCTWAAQPGEWCKQADQTFANPQPTARSSSRYDARNNRIALYVPGQGETTYDPDANYQPAAFYQPTAAGKEHQTRYTYDERHRLASITHVLCATAQRPCSGGNVLASVLASEYLYDGNDNRTTVTDNNGSGAVTRYYCYDARNQLVAVSTSSSTCGSGVIETYAYDAAGNRTSAAGRSFTYGTSNKLATCSGTACNPVFDADGRLTRVTLASGTWSYQYDADGRLTAACKASSCTTGIARLDFAYDAEGNRTRITETPASGTATVTELTYEGGRVVRETATTGATVITRAFTVDEAGAIVRMTITGDPVPLHNGTYLVTWSGHGDALALERLDPVTGTLTVANRFSYSTWGTPSLTLHNGYGDLGFRYRYVGQWGVASDGYAGADLLSMRARHYSPELGRFLQPDPARAEENAYAYAGNSPVTKVDPSGEIAWFAVAFVAFRIVAAAAPLVQRAVPYVQRALPTAQRVTPYVQRVAPTANSVGQWGERAVRAVANIGQKTPITVAGRTRIPDGLTNRVLTEIKNVKYQSLDSQLRDYLQYATSRTLRFDLWVRSDTRLSKPLQDLVNQRRITIRFIPGT